MLDWLVLVVLISVIFGGAVIVVELISAVVPNHQSSCHDDHHAANIVLCQHPTADRPLWDTTSRHDIELALQATTEQVSALRLQMAIDRDSINDTAVVAHALPTLYMFDRFVKY
jgi:hypothetical protein